MKNLTYLLFIILGLNACSQPRVVITDEEIPEEVFYLPDQVKPFSGQCVIYFANSEVIKEEMNYKNGLLHGEMISYYRNGNTRRQGHFLDGKMDGKWDSWYQNGTKRYTACYVNDTLNGEFIEWYDTGVLKGKGLYAQNKPMGNWVAYDEAGMIVKNELYDNN